MGLLLTNLSWGASFIKFQMSWPHGENRLNRHYSNIKTDLTRFEVAIHKNDATFSIYLTPKPSFANRISISTLQGNIQFSGDVVREGNGYAKGIHRYGWKQYAERINSLLINILLDVTPTH